MSPKRPSPFAPALALAVGLAPLVGCLDFHQALSACADAGRCPPAGLGPDAAVDLTPSATASSLSVSPATVAADGLSSALVVVSVRNAEGLLLAGRTVGLVHTSGHPVVQPRTAVTSADGVASFSATSASEADGTLTATVEAGEGQVELTAHPRLTFAPAFPLGGTLVGVAADGLVLGSPGEPDLSVPRGRTTFAFPLRLLDGVPYSVTVKAPPSAARCTVARGEGTMSDAGALDVEVSCVSTWLMASAGGGHSVGLKTDGTVWTWGSNLHGQLGDGTFTDRDVPQPIASGFAAVATGWHHSFALTADGGLWAFGYGKYGQLGVGFFDAGNPEPLYVGDGYAQAAGGFSHSVFLKRNGEVWTTGSDSLAQLGDGTDGLFVASPKPVASGFVAVTSKDIGSFALQADGGAFGWSYNADGEGGVGSDAGEVLVPTQLPGAFVELAAAGFNGYGVAPDGTLWSWGSADWGVLGDGTDAGFRSVPGRVGAGYAHVAAGESHALVIDADGGLWAFGLCDTGQVGNGCDGGVVRTPAWVGGDFVAASGGAQHSLGLKRDGTLWAWGANDLGQLGLGADAGLVQPRPVLVR